MSRYVPNAAERRMIDRLALAGFHVMRQRSYDALRERVRIAECMRDMEIEHRESSVRWAHRCLDEQNRLADRLAEVCTAATALGVPIADINAALAKADERGHS